MGILNFQYSMQLVKKINQVIFLFRIKMEYFTNSDRSRPKNDLHKFDLLKELAKNDAQHLQ